MPRGKSTTATSAFQQVQRQARALVASLRVEIRQKESELKRLKDEVASLERLSGNPVRFAARSGAAPSSNGRVDWRAVLENLPKQFSAADVRENRAVKHKRPSEIFAAITRWIDAGMVSKKSRGVYERA